MSDLYQELIRRIDRLERLLGDQVAQELADAGGAALSSDPPQPLGTAAAGTAGTAARADHVHALPTAAQVGALPTSALSGAAPQALGAAAAGSSTSVSRADHVHPVPTATQVGALATSALSSATPQALGTAAAGSSTSVSRADHVHPMPTTAQIGALPLAGGVLSGDIGLNGDTGTIMQRSVDHWIVPTDHFNAFSGWTWATNGVFDGAPSTVDTTSRPSLLVLGNSNIVDDHFAFRSVPGSGLIDMYARLGVGILGSFVGLRIDDGTDSNYAEIRLDPSPTPGLQRLTFLVRKGGGTITTVATLDQIVPSFVLINMTYNQANGNVNAFWTKDTYIPMPITVTPNGGNTWTAARGGIIYGQRGAVTVATRVGFVDWIRL